MGNITTKHSVKWVNKQLLTDFIYLALKKESNPIIQSSTNGQSFFMDKCLPHITMEAIKVVCSSSIATHSGHIISSVTICSFHYHVQRLQNNNALRLFLPHVGYTNAYTTNVSFAKQHITLYIKMLFLFAHFNLSSTSF